MLTFDENFTRMKKIFKIALLCAALAGALACFSSCSKDGIAINKLIGKWKAETMSMGGVTIDYEEIAGGGMFITFQRDGLYVAESTFQGQTQTESGTWEYSDDVLTTTINGEESLFNVVELKASEMVLSQENDIDGKKVEVVLTLNKVK